MHGKSLILQDGLDYLTNGGVIIDYEDPRTLGREQSGWAIAIH
jgi:hypothetical protein